jgi:hypothetical protein
MKSRITFNSLTEVAPSNLFSIGDGREAGLPSPTSSHLENTS